MKAKDSKRLSERNSLCYTDAHFPTRDDLLAPLVAEGIDELAELGRHLPETHPLPQRALFDWLDAFGAKAATYQGLPESVIRTLHDSESGLFRSCELMRQTCARLLARAQQSGEIRRDVTADDLLAITAAVAGAAELRGQNTSHFIAVVTAGLITSKVDR